MRPRTILAAGVMAMFIVTPVAILGAPNWACAMTGALATLGAILLLDNWRRPS